MIFDSGDCIRDCVMGLNGHEVMEDLCSIAINIMDRCPIILKKNI